MKRKIRLDYKNGIIEGILLHATDASNLVIIVNGHNGFYNYGMFPFIQDYLFKEGLSSFSFNFSHGGIIGDSDVFEDFKKYSMNCIRLELEDLLYVLSILDSEPFFRYKNYFLLAHSMGGIPAILCLGKTSKKINGVILYNSASDLSFWPKDMVSEWTQKGIYHLKNNRTKQDLPQGKEFLDDVINFEKKWNLAKQLNQVSTPFLIVHGMNDEAVPIRHGQNIYNSLNNKTDSKFVAIENGTHTFNTRHPFEEASTELLKSLEYTSSWIKNMTR